MKRDLRILIIGTLPFYKSAQSREFETYFSQIEEQSLKQIFITSSNPVKGYCSELFQLTDRIVFKRRIAKEADGIVYHNSDLPNEDTTHLFKTNDGKIAGLIKKSDILKRLVRNIIWREKYWKTQKLLSWVDSFKPNVIYLSWSNDKFLLDMALYFSKKYNANILVSITDDYLLEKRNLPLLYKCYFRKYRRSAFDILNNCHNKIFFIDNKIRDQYDLVFGIKGEVIHVGTTEYKKNNSIILNEQIDTILYFGNVGYQRYKTIIKLGQIIDKLNLDIKIHVYSQNARGRIAKSFSKVKSILLKHPIPYDLMKTKITNKSVILLVESLDSKKNIEKVRYSLSTKVADSLSYCRPVIAIGNKETGMMSYLLKNNCCLCATTLDEIKHVLKMITVHDFNYNPYWLNSKKCIERDFDIGLNGKAFKKIAYSMIDYGGNDE